MAVDVCSEIVWSCGSSPGISPRISFSHDLKGCDHVPVETCLVASDSARDFDFCITASQFFLELSRPADELFADGKILPMPMIRTRSHAMRSDPDPPKHPAIKGSLSIEGRTPRVQDSPPPAEKKQLKELLLFDPEESPRRATKSFWSFSRSSSLNCESQRSKGLIRSLQFLARSNSTGSVLNANPDGKIPSAREILRKASNNARAGDLFRCQRQDLQHRVAQKGRGEVMEVEEEEG
ncbi:hypothetical protein MLD38_025819 [Melastoma candidum]|uniref:Uncharacterized protein n=1 Tax=Melastoma candidum TaxID=119954 RepID=A0ACB9NY62_9MYRT|nr:hypothetical protein MLD38_025819 [Melastoma candidum]